MATIHDQIKETIRAHLTLVHVFHAYSSADIAWVAHALSHYTSVRYGGIASISEAHDATQFGVPYVPYMLVHSTACSFRPNRRGP
jgi:hypothetical protein